jgi:PPIC-type PPIASE domain
MNRSLRVSSAAVVASLQGLGLGGLGALVLGGLVLVAGCPGSPDGPTITGKPTTAELQPASSPVVSTEILAREPVANTANVKHILISWNDLAEAFGGRLDPRAAKRSKADAENEVRSLMKQLQSGGDFDTVMKAHSEDTSSAASGRVFTVTPDAQLVIEFRQISLRLNPGEIGICQSDFGFHIIKRVD